MNVIGTNPDMTPGQKDEVWLETDQFSLAVNPMCAAFNHGEVVEFNGGEYMVYSVTMSSRGVTTFKLRDWSGAAPKDRTRMDANRLGMTVLRTYPRKWVSVSEQMQVAAGSGW